MPAGGGPSQGLRIELADPARREDGGLDGVGVEQLDQAPDADPAAELALRQLQRRLVQEAAQQHGVEVGREVDRDPRAIGPRQIVDEFVAVLIRGPFCHEGVDAFASGSIHRSLLGPG